MKMTMHIDEALLARVMEEFGCASKTEAVEMALREMDRKSRFKALVALPSPFTPEELGEAVDPDYDVASMRVAEPRASYGKPHGRKRSR